MSDDMENFDSPKIAVSDQTPLLVQSGGLGSEEDAHVGNQLGILNGVIVPCLLNIVGAILFLRLSWAVGHVGIGGLLLMFALGELQVTLTVLSLAALISNGEMKGGGAYLIISRAVGPELGGAIGVLFYLSYSVGATFYLVAFAESFVLSVFPDTTWNAYGIHLLVGSVALLVVLGISLIGAEGFTKINVILFLIQFGSILWGALSIFSTPDPCCAEFPGSCEPPPGQQCGLLEHGGEFHGWSSANFRGNLWLDNIDSFAPPNNNNNDTMRAVHDVVARAGGGETDCPGGVCSWLFVYAIMFPAVTGIMEGANLSGDLKNPNRDIWRGTLLAIGVSFLIYVFCMFAFAGGFDGRTITVNLYVFQEVAFGTQWLVVVGILISTFSSGLGAIFGGSRILQAIARDSLFPGLGVFGRGSGKGDEPRIAVLLTWGIAQACLFIGKLDIVAPIITTFFCISYGMVNLCCFLVDVSGTPNFRPRFKYFTWWTSLLGFIVNMIMMFVLQWVYALVALALFAGLMVWLTFGYTPGDDGVDWGDVRMALVFHQVRKFLLRMDPRQHHGKLWRPSVLFLTNNIETPLTQFCNYLKRGGIYVLGGVVLNDGPLEDAEKNLRDMEESWLDVVEKEKLKAFVQVLVAPDIRYGYHNLCTTAGLGAMAPNTVVLPLLEEGQPEGLVVPRDHMEYWQVVRDAHKLGKMLVLACNFRADLDIEHMLESKTEERSIDIWIPQHIKCSNWNEFTGAPLAELALSYGLQRNKASLRLVQVVDESVDLHYQREVMLEIVKRKGRFRVGKKGRQIEVIHNEGRGVFPSFDAVEYFRAVNSLVHEHTTPLTSLVLLPLPKLPSDAKGVELFFEQVYSLVQDLPPTLLVLAAEDQELMSTSL